MKKISLVFIIVGISLILLGTLIHFVYPNFALIDIDPPIIRYSFPFDGFVGKSSELSEFCIYVTDPNIASVAYYDSYYPSQLLFSRASTTSAPSMWIPDLNHDGAVDGLDANIISSAWLSTPSSPNWNPDADLNKDNIVNAGDLAILAQYMFTYLFVAHHQYLSGIIIARDINFTIMATDTYGNNVILSGRYRVGMASSVVEGTWYINNMDIEGMSLLQLNSTEVEVKFSAYTTMILNPEDYNVTAIVNTERILLDYNKVGGYHTWMKTIELTGTSTLTLSASTNETLNYAVITLNTPVRLEFQTAYILWGSGGFMIVLGVIINKREGSKRRGVEY